MNASQRIKIEYERVERKRNRQAWYVEGYRDEGGHIVVAMNFWYDADVMKYGGDGEAALIEFLREMFPFAELRRVH